MSAPDVERVNAINVGLMLLSLAVAWVVPFELFLFAYAVLGPLHYRAWSPRPTKPTIRRSGGPL